ncbi:MAG: hypothetical protein AAGF49_02895 [Pseudomonadota bacterium]
MTACPHAALLDTLLPGDSDWPPASNVIGEIALSEAGEALALRVDELPETAREGAVAAFESAHPESFAELFGAVTDAYYATPEVAAVLAARASSGPQEPAPFDPRLLDGVRTERRGRRRL